MKYKYQIIKKINNSIIYDNKIPCETEEQARIAGNNKRREIRLSGVNYGIKTIPLAETVSEENILSDSIHQRYEMETDDYDDSA